MSVIETERLILRPMTEADGEAVFQWTGDPVVNRYMPYPVHKNVEETKSWLRSLQGKEEEFGFCLKETGRLIGAGSIKYREEFDAWEVGYNLRKDCWGKGYATEAAKALLQWAYEHGARRFMVRHATANTASGNVLKKCGYQFSHLGRYSRYDDSETFDATYYTMEME